MTTPANTDDLLAWLRAQLDEDERVARKARQRGEWWFASGDKSVDLHALTAHAMRWDPARVLRQVERDRRVLDRHGPIELFSSMYCTHCGVLGGQRARDVNWPCHEILDTAAPHADRPGYREGWRP